MATIADKTFAGLTASINDWTERSDSADLLASYVGIATAQFNLILRDRRQETTDTLSTTSGVADLPDDFLEMLAVSHATYGDLEQTSYRALKLYNPSSANTIPRHYAVYGEDKVAVDASISDDFSVLYRAKIPDLSDTTTTNWVLTLVPQAYLFMSIAALHARYESFDKAQAFQASAQNALDLAGVQSIVSQFGNAPLVMRGVRP